MKNISAVQSDQYSPKALPLVNSVLGPISADKLGGTLIHEHFCFAYPGWLSDASIAPYDREAALSTGLKVCQTLKEIGIQTVVDPTPNDTGGRDPLLYEELSERTGINIICTTGLYTEEQGASAYWKNRLRFGTDISKMIAEMMQKEITGGIRNTGVRAGAIKVASSPEMTDYEKVVHKAAAEVQQLTGVPIITHTEGPGCGVKQAEFLLGHGANPKKVLIGHVSNSKDIAYHRSILATGVRIGFDRLGVAPLLGVPDSVSVENIAALCKEGYTDRILLSQDTCNFWIGRPNEVPEEIKKLLVNWRIDHIVKDIVPMLKEKGANDNQIKVMMVDNPKNLFLGE